MRARRETATAVRANIAKDAVYAALAKCTFKRADHRVGRFGRQTFIAMFTSWP